MTIMRPISSIATALLIAGLAVAGCGRSQPDQPTTPPSQPLVVTTAPTPKTPAPVSAPTPAPTPRPRILSVTTIPPLPKEGGFSVLPAGAGTLTVRVRAVNARWVRFYLTPTGTEMFDENQMIGQDTNGRDGWNLAWRYKDEPLLAHITVTAVGANGVTSPWVTLGVYHPESAAAPRSVPAPGTIVGLWPVRTLAQARTLQDGADAGRQGLAAVARTRLDLVCGHRARPVRAGGAPGGPGRPQGGSPQLRVGGHPLPGPARPPGRWRHLGHHPDREPSELAGSGLVSRPSHGGRFHPSSHDGAGVGPGRLRRGLA
jgi:hypothetical protein